MSSDRRAVVTAFWTTISHIPIIVWSFLFQLTSPVRKLFTILTGGWNGIKYKHRRLLCWLEEVSKREVHDLNTLWKDGSILCDAIHSIVPGVCDLERDHKENTIRHAQDLATHVLHLPPGFSQTELQKDLTQTMEKRFWRYLISFKHALKLRADRNSVEEENIPEYLIADEYLARGMGLITAGRNQRAIFFIYSKDGSSLIDIMIEIRGPNGEYGVVTSGEDSDPEAHCIPVDYRLTSDYLKVSYEPRSLGLHEIYLTRYGFHIPGSPFPVNVEISCGLALERYSNKKWFSEEEKERQKQEEQKQKNMKVVSRIIDFVTEKMYLTDDGKLIKVTDETKLSSPSPCLNRRGRTGRSVSPRPRSKKVLPTRSKSLTNQKIIQAAELLQTRCNSEKKKSYQNVETQVSENLQLLVFQERCQNIVTTCDFLLTHTSKQKSLEIITMAENILQTPSKKIRVDYINKIDDKHFTEKQMNSTNKLKIQPTLSCDEEDEEDMILSKQRHITKCRTSEINVINTETKDNFNYQETQKTDDLSDDNYEYNDDSKESESWLSSEETDSLIHGLINTENQTHSIEIQTDNENKQKCSEKTDTLKEQNSTYFNENNSDTSFAHRVENARKCFKSDGNTKQSQSSFAVITSRIGGQKLHLNESRTGNNSTNEELGTSSQNMKEKNKNKQNYSHICKSPRKGITISKLIQKFENPLLSSETIDKEELIVPQQKITDTNKHEITKKCKQNTMSLTSNKENIQNNKSITERKDYFEVNDSPMKMLQICDQSKGKGHEYIKENTFNDRIFKDHKQRDSYELAKENTVTDKTKYFEKLHITTADKDLEENTQNLNREKDLNKSDLKISKSNLITDTISEVKNEQSQMISHSITQTKNEIHNSEDQNQIIKIEGEVKSENECLSEKESYLYEEALKDLNMSTETVIEDNTISLKSESYNNKTKLITINTKCEDKSIQEIFLNTNEKIKGITVTNEQDTSIETKEDEGLNEDENVSRRNDRPIPQKVENMEEINSLVAETTLEVLKNGIEVIAENTQTHTTETEQMKGENPKNNEITDQCTATKQLAENDINEITIYEEQREPLLSELPLNYYTDATKLLIKESDELHLRLATVGGMTEIINTIYRDKDTLQEKNGDDTQQISENSIFSKHITETELSMGEGNKKTSCKLLEEMVKEHKNLVENQNITRTKEAELVYNEEINFLTEKSIQNRLTKELDPTTITTSIETVTPQISGVEKLDEDEIMKDKNWLVKTIQESKTVEPSLYSDPKYKIKMEREKMCTTFEEEILNRVTLCNERLNDDKIKSEETQPQLAEKLFEENKTEDKEILEIITINTEKQLLTFFETTEQIFTNATKLSAPTSVKNIQNQISSCIAIKVEESIKEEEKEDEIPAIIFDFANNPLPMKSELSTIENGMELSGPVPELKGKQNTETVEYKIQNELTLTMNDKITALKKDNERVRKPSEIVIESSEKNNQEIVTSKSEEAVLQSITESEKSNLYLERKEIVEKEIIESPLTSLEEKINISEKNKQVEPKEKDDTINITESEHNSGLLEINSEKTVDTTTLHKTAMDLTHKMKEAVHHQDISDTSVTEKIDKNTIGKEEKFLSIDKLKERSNKHDTKELVTKSSNDQKSYETKTQPRTLKIENNNLSTEEMITSTTKLEEDESTEKLKSYDTLGKNNNEIEEKLVTETKNDELEKEQCDTELQIQTDMGTELLPYISCDNLDRTQILTKKIITEIIPDGEKDEPITNLSTKEVDTEVTEFTIHTTLLEKITELNEKSTEKQTLLTNLEEISEEAKFVKTETLEVKTENEGDETVITRVESIATESPLVKIDTEVTKEVEIEISNSMNQKQRNETIEDAEDQKWKKESEDELIYNEETTSTTPKELMLERQQTVELQTTLTETGLQITINEEGNIAKVKQTDLVKGIGRNDLIEIPSEISHPEQEKITFEDMIYVDRRGTEKEENETLKIKGDEYCLAIKEEPKLIVKLCETKTTDGDKEMFNESIIDHKHTTESHKNEILSTFQVNDEKQSLSNNNEQFTFSEEIMKNSEDEEEPSIENNFAPQNFKNQELDNAITTVESLSNKCTIFSDENSQLCWTEKDKKLPEINEKLHFLQTKFDNDTNSLVMKSLQNEKQNEIGEDVVNNEKRSQQLGVTNPEDLFQIQEPQENFKNELKFVTQRLYNEDETTSKEHDTIDEENINYEKLKQRILLRTSTEESNLVQKCILENDKDIKTRISESNKKDGKEIEQNKEITKKNIYEISLEINEEGTENFKTEIFDEKLTMEIETIENSTFDKQVKVKNENGIVINESLNSETEQTEKVQFACFQEENELYYNKKERIDNKGKEEEQSGCVIIPEECNLGSANVTINKHLTTSQSKVTELLTFVNTNTLALSHSELENEISELIITETKDVNKNYKTDYIIPESHTKESNEFMKEMPLLTSIKTKSPEVANSMEKLKQEINISSTATLQTEELKAIESHNFIGIKNAKVEEIVQITKTTDKKTNLEGNKERNFTNVDRLAYINTDDLNEPTETLNYVKQELQCETEGPKQDFHETFFKILQNEKNADESLIIKDTISVDPAEKHTTKKENFLTDTIIEHIQKEDTKGNLTELTQFGGTSEETIYTIAKESTEVKREDKPEPVKAIVCSEMQLITEQTSGQEQCTDLYKPKIIVEENKNKEKVNKNFGIREDSMKETIGISYETQEKDKVGDYSKSDKAIPVETNEIQYKDEFASTLKIKNVDEKIKDIEIKIAEDYNRTKEDDSKEIIAITRKETQQEMYNQIEVVGKLCKDDKKLIQKIGTQLINEENKEALQKISKEKENVLQIEPTELIQPITRQQENKGEQQCYEADTVQDDQEVAKSLISGISEARLTEETYLISQEKMDERNNTTEELERILTEKTEIMGEMQKTGSPRRLKKGHLTITHLVQTTCTEVTDIVSKPESENEMIELETETETVSVEVNNQQQKENLQETDIIQEYVNKNELEPTLITSIMTEEEKITGTLDFIKQGSTNEKSHDVTDQEEKKEIQATTITYNIEESCKTENLSESNQEKSDIVLTIAIEERYTGELEEKLTDIMKDVCITKDNANETKISNQQKNAEPDLANIVYETESCEPVQAKSDLIHRGNEKNKNKYSESPCIKFNHKQVKSEESTNTKNLNKIITEIKENNSVYQFEKQTNLTEIQESDKTSSLTRNESNFCQESMKDVFSEQSNVKQMLSLNDTKSEKITEKHEFPTDLCVNKAKEKKELSDECNIHSNVESTTKKTSESQGQISEDTINICEQNFKRSLLDVNAEECKWTNENTMQKDSPNCKEKGSDDFEAEGRNVIKINQNTEISEVNTGEINDEKEINLKTELLTEISILDSKNLVFEETHRFGIDKISSEEINTINELTNSETEEYKNITKPEIYKDKLKNLEIKNFEITCNLTEMELATEEIKIMKSSENLKTIKIQDKQNISEISDETNSWKTRKEIRESQVENTCNNGVLTENDSILNLNTQNFDQSTYSEITEEILVTFPSEKQDTDKLLPNHDEEPTQIINQEYRSVDLYMPISKESEKITNKSINNDKLSELISINEPDDTKFKTNEEYCIQSENRTTKLDKILGHSIKSQDIPQKTTSTKIIETSSNLSDIEEIGKKPRSVSKLINYFESKPKDFKPIDKNYDNTDIDPICCNKKIKKCEQKIKYIEYFIERSNKIDSTENKIIVDHDLLKQVQDSEKEKILCDESTAESIVEDMHKEKNETFTNKEIIGMEKKKTTNINKLKEDKFIMDCKETIMIKIKVGKSNEINKTESADEDNTIKQSEKQETNHKKIKTELKELANKIEKQDDKINEIKNQGQNNKPNTMEKEIDAKKAINIEELNKNDKIKITIVANSKDDKTSEIEGEQSDKEAINTSSSTDIQEEMRNMADEQPTEKVIKIKLITDEEQGKSIKMKELTNIGEVMNNVTFIESNVQTLPQDEGQDETDKIEEHQDIEKAQKSSSTENQMKMTFQADDQDGTGQTPQIQAITDDGDKTVKNEELQDIEESKNPLPTESQEQMTFQTKEQGKTDKIIKIQHIVEEDDKTEKIKEQNIEEAKNPLTLIENLVQTPQGKEEDETDKIIKIQAIIDEGDKTDKIEELQTIEDTINTLSLENQLNMTFQAKEQGDNEQIKPQQITEEEVETEKIKEQRIEEAKNILPSINTPVQTTPQGKEHKETDKIIIEAITDEEDKTAKIEESINIVPLIEGNKQITPQGEEKDLTNKLIKIHLISDEEENPIEIENQHNIEDAIKTLSSMESEVKITDEAEAQSKTDTIIKFDLITDEEDENVNIQENNIEEAKNTVSSTESQVRDTSQIEEQKTTDKIIIKPINDEEDKIGIIKEAINTLPSIENNEQMRPQKKEKYQTVNLMKIQSIEYDYNKTTEIKEQEKIEDTINNLFSIECQLKMAFKDKDDDVTNKIIKIEPILDEDNKTIDIENEQNIDEDNRINSSSIEYQVKMTPQTEKKHETDNIFILKPILTKDDNTTENEEQKIIEEDMHPISSVSIKNQIKMLPKFGEVNETDQITKSQSVTEEEQVSMADIEEHKNIGERDYTLSITDSHEKMKSQSEEKDEIDKTMKIQPITNKVEVTTNKIQELAKDKESMNTLNCELEIVSFVKENMNPMIIEENKSIQLHTKVKDRHDLVESELNKDQCNITEGTFQLCRYDSNSQNMVTNIYTNISTELTSPDTSDESFGSSKHLLLCTDDSTKLCEKEEGSVVELSTSDVYESEKIIDETENISIKRYEKEFNLLGDEKESILIFNKNKSQTDFIYVENVQDNEEEQLFDKIMLLNEKKKLESIPDKKSETKILIETVFSDNILRENKINLPNEKKENDNVNNESFSINNDSFTLNSSSKTKANDASNNDILIKGHLMICNQNGNDNKEIITTVDNDNNDENYQIKQKTHKIRDIHDEPETQNKTGVTFNISTEFLEEKQLESISQDISDYLSNIQSFIQPPDLLDSDNSMNQEFNNSSTSTDDTSSKDNAQEKVNDKALLLNDNEEHLEQDYKLKNSAETFLDESYKEISEITDELYDQFSNKTEETSGNVWKTFRESFKENQRNDSLIVQLSTDSDTYMYDNNIRHAEIDESFSTLSDCLFESLLSGNELIENVIEPNHSIFEEKFMNSNLEKRKEERRDKANEKIIEDDFQNLCNEMFVNTNEPEDYVFKDNIERQKIKDNLSKINLISNITRSTEEEREINASDNNCLIIKQTMHKFADIEGPQESLSKQDNVHISNSENNLIEPNNQSDNNTITDEYLLFHAEGGTTEIINETQLDKLEENFLLSCSGGGESIAETSMEFEDNFLENFTTNDDPIESEIDDTTSKFHLWPSNVEFGPPSEEKLMKDITNEIDFDSIISAPSLNEALEKLEKRIKDQIYEKESVNSYNSNDTVTSKIDNLTEVIKKDQEPTLFSTLNQDNENIKATGIFEGAPNINLSFEVNNPYLKTDSMFSDTDQFNHSLKTESENFPSISYSGSSRTSSRMEMIKEETEEDEDPLSLNKLKSMNLNEEMETNKKSVDFDLHSRTNIEEFPKPKISFIISHPNSTDYLSDSENLNNMTEIVKDSPNEFQQYNYNEIKNDNQSLNKTSYESKEIIVEDGEQIINHSSEKINELKYCIETPLNEDINEKSYINDESSFQQMDGTNTEGYQSNNLIADTILTSCKGNTAILPEEREIMKNEGGETILKLREELTDDQAVTHTKSAINIGASEKDDLSDIIKPDSETDPSKYENSLVLSKKLYWDQKLERISKKINSNDSIKKKLRTKKSEELLKENAPNITSMKISTEETVFKKEGENSFSPKHTKTVTAVNEDEKIYNEINNKKDKVNNICESEANKNRNSNTIKMVDKWKGYWDNILKEKEGTSNPPKPNIFKKQPSLVVHGVVDINKRIFGTTQPKDTNQNFSKVHECTNKILKSSSKVIRKTEEDNREYKVSDECGIAENTYTFEDNQHILNSDTEFNINATNSSLIKKERKVLERIKLFENKSFTHNYIPNLESNESSRNTTPMTTPTMIKIDYFDDIKIENEPVTTHTRRLESVESSDNEFYNPLTMTPCGRIRSFSTGKIEEVPDNENLNVIPKDTDEMSAEKEDNKFLLQAKEISIIRAKSEGNLVFDEKIGSHKRFEKAKNFFKRLEQSSSFNDIDKISTKKINKHYTNQQSIDSDSCGEYCKPKRKENKYRRRGKRRKDSMRIRSAPTSDSENKTKKYDSDFGGSERRKSKKISEIFHIKDLFRDISKSSDGIFRGIPNKKAVLASLKSVEDLSVAENTAYKEEPLRSQSLSSIPSGYQEEYPYLPTTPPNRFKSRSQYEGSLISRKKLILELDI